MHADPADLLAQIRRVGPPNVHWIDDRGGDATDKLVAVAGTTPIVVRLFHIHRPISKDELLNGIMRLLEVPYYGPDPDWDRMAGNWDAFADAIGDLEWLGGTPEHGVVLVVTLIGPSDLATDELVSTLVDIWESRAEEVWNPKIRAPYHLVLAERGSRD